ncbi:class I SAM-dependent methyltransferase [Bradyrhizobium sp. BR 10261]|uniref:class I SAM-dependent methyltransferase n=1 Tax=Bradyrhizobium sp. BR 10261 TaxID=2749992 RepID=UPI001C64D291|nr:class I SAM-dependent methyltransferase [Bradyrhizobium sp. BR 10261]MBW7961162.1 class I SAM-dependent methyltransferase [Bradyrhizobium sp. BR 10261]
MSIYEQTRDIEGWLMPGETQLLYDLARDFGDVILEVGTFRGRSATVLTSGAARRRGVRVSKAQFFSIDINPAARLLAYELLRKRGLANRALFFHGTLPEFRAKFPITPTLAFIDGDHTYEGVLADLAELSTLLAPNTPVVFHDYLNPDTPGVSKAVDEWCQDGFANVVHTIDASAQVLTTTRCSGKRRHYPDRAFRAARGELMLPLKHRIAARMPWLVPIVRTLKGRSRTE